MRRSRRLRATNPVLIVLEDVQWADPRAWNCSGGECDRMQTFPCCCFITFRPEFEPPWIGQPHVTSLTLNRLKRREAEAMIDRVSGNRQLAANVSRKSSSTLTAFLCSWRK